MITVLFVINEHDDVSFDRMTVDLAARLPPESFSAFVYSLKSRGSLEKRFRNLLGRRFFVSPGGTAADVGRIVSIIRNESVDIIHTSALRSEYVVFLARALVLFRRPIHVAVRHNYLFRERSLYHLVKNVLYVISCMAADVNICVGKHIRDGVAAFSRRRPLYIANGVAPLPAKRLSEGVSAVPVVLYTGAFISRKGILCLLQALTLLRQPFRCVLAGDGPEKERAGRFIADHGLSDRVRLVPHQNTAPLYRAADIFVLPSRDEGLSLSLLESMHAGLPSVVSGIRANTDVITDGKEGFVFPADDPVALRGRLDALLSSSALRRRLGSAARSKALRLYTQNEMNRKYQAAYRALVRQKKEAV